MVARGYVKTVREAFDKYLGSGKPAMSRARSSRPRTRCGSCAGPAGVPVFAHPGLADRDAIIPSLVAAGLMGIECIYPNTRRPRAAAYVELCRQHDLLVTGGSDFHGPPVRAAVLGNPPVPLAAWEALQAKAAVARASLPA